MGFLNSIFTRIQNLRFFRKRKERNIAGKASCFSFDVTEAANVLNSYRKDSSFIPQPLAHKDDFSCDISVIVPCYNASKYVRKCLDSILKQKTSAKFEIIAYEDCSTDNTRDILKTYEDRVLVIYGETNKGQGFGRNEAIRKSSGRYICFVDSDDYLPDDNSLEAMYSYAKDDQYDIVQAQHFTDRFGSLKKCTPSVCEPVDAKRILTGFPWAKLYKRSLFENSLFPEGVKYEDTANSLSWFLRVNRTVTIPDYVYVYRSNQASDTHASLKVPSRIDTWYVTNILLDHSINELSKIDDKTLISLLNGQFICNRSRTFSLSPEIQYAIFVLTADMYKSLARNREIETDRLPPLLKALQNRSFLDYLLA